MARSAEYNQKARHERREQILTHALRMFGERGLAATKTSDIAEAAGMSQGLLYHYFRSKEDVFTELIRAAFEKMNGAARALEAMPAPPAEKIRRAIAELLKSIEESQAFADTVLLIAQAGVSDATPAAARAILRAESGVPYAVVARILREGQRDGSIKPHDADDLAVVFWSAIKGLAIHKAVNGAAFRAPNPRILASMFLSEHSEGATDE